MTTSGFSTPGALDAASLPGERPIDLVDGNLLLELLIEHEVGVKRREGAPVFDLLPIASGG